MDAKPFVKWAGGKTQLLPVIRSMMPSSFRCYYEPFVGGGALFFDLKPVPAVINDANPALVNAYRWVRDDPYAVNAELRRLDAEIAQDGEPFFYVARNLFNKKKLAGELDAELAALFVFLSKHSFNGIFRENRKGEYNAPTNHFTGASTTEEILLADSAVLKNTEILCGDFEDAVRNAQKDNFVFFDSPYAPLKATSFDKYTASGFPDEDHRRLADVFRKLDKRGCFLMLTNHDTPFVRSLYDGFHIRTVSARRSINCDGGNRKGTEIVVTNYRNG